MLAAPFHPGASRWNGWDSVGWYVVVRSNIHPPYCSSSVESMHLCVLVVVVLLYHLEHNFT